MAVSCIYFCLNYVVTRFSTSLMIATLTCCNNQFFPPNPYSTQLTHPKEQQFNHADLKGASSSLLSLAQYCAQYVIEHYQRRIIRVTLVYGAQFGQQVTMPGFLMWSVDKNGFTGCLQTVLLAVHRFWGVQYRCNDFCSLFYSLQSIIFCP